MLTKSLNSVKQENVLRWTVVVLALAFLAATMTGAFALHFDILSVAKESGVNIPKWIIQSISYTTSAHALVSLVALAVGVTMPLAWAAAVGSAGAVAF